MNRLQTIITTVALLLVIPLSLIARASGPSYRTRHVHGLHNWSLIFPAEKGKEVYVDYRLALEIIEIQCDGKKLEPALVEGHLHIGYESYHAADAQVIYMSRYDELRTAVFENGTENPDKVWEYSISKDTKLVVVKYRVRYPKGSPSEIITLISESRPVSRKKD